MGLPLRHSSEPWQPLSWLQRVAAVKLRCLREERGLSQESVAERAQLALSSVARLENGRDLDLDTVRRYVESLGGTLEVCVRLGRRRLRLRL